jgi:PAB-dependent poly(A)-specific ribonuclease subunit 2
VSTELGFLFRQIECLSQYARIFPGESTNSKVGAFVPTNFLTSFAAMPEAEALALLDGAPAAVERARRPEAFLRFLLHHLNKEVSISTKKVGSKIIDGLHGFNFVSINEFPTGSGPPSTSKHRALTIDLSYESFVKGSTKVKFGEVLRHSLSKESPLRAWCQETRSYETVVQRKIATSLPTVLALSCCCAGKRNEEELSIWRTNAPENGHWLPEMVEIEINDNGNVIVRESTEEAGSSDRIWMEFKGSSQLPSSIADIVASSLGSIRKRRFRLDAVLSFVRDDMDAATIEQLSLSRSEEANGHHVLHARIPSGYTRRAFDNQRWQADRVASTMESASKDTTKDVPLTLTSGTKLEVFRKRIEDVDQRLKSLDESIDDWVLFNGFVVSSTVVEDARAFHMPFKEPCLVIFRAVDDSTKSKKENKKDEEESMKIPTTVMRTRSISTGRAPDYSTKNDLPGAGGLIAFDAEFVSVQEEESVLTTTGSKLVTRETRYALARVSVIDCRSGNIILDDHVLPCEPVVDYLTRFSGIVEGDLDPKNSPHHLISMRSAYLKLRCLTER